MNKLLPIFIVVVLVAAGCASDVTSQQEELKQEDSASLTEKVSRYTLAAVVNDQYELLIETNLRLSKENYNLSHQEGEGHVHLYINNHLVGPLQDKEPYSLLDYLSNGENAIRLALASNNHDESVYQTYYNLVVTYESSGS